MSGLVYSVCQDFCKFNSVTIENPDTEFYGTVYLNDFNSEGERVNKNEINGTLEPVMESVFKVEFEGNDGDTTWVEEIQDLEPNNKVSCEIDTDQFIVGSSSLLIPASGYLEYIIPGITSDNFVWTYYFRNSSTGTIYLDMWSNIPGNQTQVWVDMFSETLNLYLDDYNGDNFLDIEISRPTANIWHKVVITSSGRTVTFSIDDIELSTVSASVDNPLNGLNYFGFYPYSPNSLWIDSMKFESPSGEFSPVSWNIICTEGIVSVHNTIVSNSQASGGARFLSYLTWGNLNGGNNSGWEFGTNFIPKISLLN